MKLGKKVFVQYKFNECMFSYFVEMYMKYVNNLGFILGIDF